MNDEEFLQQEIYRLEEEIDQARENLFHAESEEEEDYWLDQLNYSEHELWVTCLQLEDVIYGVGDE